MRESGARLQRGRGNRAGTMHFEHTTHQGARECASRSRGTRDELRVRWDGSETAVDTFARASRRELWCAGYSNCPASPPPFGTQPSPQTLMLPPLSLGVGVHIHVKPSTKLYLLIVNNPSHEPCRLCCEGARRERERERERRVRECLAVREIGRASYQIV